MNQGGEAAEQIVRMSLEGFEVACRISGSGAEKVAILLYNAMREQQKTSGKTRLKSLLKSGKELSVFQINKDDLERFQKESKKYGFTYYALLDKDSTDGKVDIMAKAEDSSKINRIIDKFKIATFDRAKIESEIEKTRNERQKGIKKKDKEVIIEEKDKNKHVTKESESKVPHHLEGTEKKNPLSPSLKSKSSIELEVSSNEKKPSVKEKLDEYKKIVNKKLEEKRAKERNSKTPKLKKDKSKEK